MNILAIDTATEQCSVAIVSSNQRWSRDVPTPRSHADLILPMVDELLRESTLRLTDCDVLAFGRGPGSFTGVRIAVGVIQGLALASQKPVIGISNLAAVAFQAARKYSLPIGARILVCMDARMKEVYWARYRVNSDEVVELEGVERVDSPTNVIAAVRDEQFAFGVGTGWRAYDDLRQALPLLQIDDSLLPRAIDIADLSIPEWRLGRVVSAAEAQPIYLRDQVAALPRVTPL